MKKQTGTFRDYVKAPKNYSLSQAIQNKMREVRNWKYNRVLKLAKERER